MRAILALLFFCSTILCAGGATQAAIRKSPSGQPAQHHELTNHEHALTRHRTADLFRAQRAQRRADWRHARREAERHERYERKLERHQEASVPRHAEEPHDVPAVHAAAGEPRKILIAVDRREIPLR